MDRNLINLKETALKLVENLSPNALAETTGRCHGCPGRSTCDYDAAEAYRAIWAYQEAANAAGVAYDEVPGGHLPEVQAPDLTVEQVSKEVLEEAREIAIFARLLGSIFGG